MMYRLATMHSVTVRQTDRQTFERQTTHYHANSRSYSVQYDRLKSQTILKIQVCTDWLAATPVQ